MDYAKNTLLIIGESGTGKSSSISTLNPDETYIISVIGKSLPFKNWSKLYRKSCPEKPNGNYFISDDARLISKVIEGVNLKRPEIKTLIIDDFQYIMANEFMRRAKERGYDKFTDIQTNSWNIITQLTQTRDDLLGIIMWHSDLHDSGVTKLKTIGKMLNDKITLEGLFSIILHSIVHDGKYKFLTQFQGGYLAKSPREMFADTLIDNDLQFVKEMIEEYN